MNMVSNQKGILMRSHLKRVSALSLCQLLLNELPQALRYAKSLIPEEVSDNLNYITRRTFQFSVSKEGISNIETVNLIYFNKNTFILYLIINVYLDNRCTFFATVQDA